MSKAMLVTGDSLSMETVKNIASAIIVIGGLVAVIDVLIGRTGQEKPKNFCRPLWRKGV